MHMVFHRKLYRFLPVVAILALTSIVSAQSETGPVNGDDAKWLLDNAEVVFKLNIKQMMESKLMKDRGIKEMRKMIEGNAKAKEILDSMGLDPVKDFDAVLASAAGTSASDAKALIAIVGKFDRPKVEKAMSQSDKIKSSKEGNTTVFEFEMQGQSLYGAFANDNTMVMTQDKEATLNAVKNGGKKTAEMSKGMKSALARFSGQESMAMAMVVSEELRKMLQMAPRGGEAASKLQTIMAGITVTENVDFNIRGITGDAKAAGTLAKLIDGLKAAAGLAGDDVPKQLIDLLDSVKVTSDKESVKIDLKISKEVIEKSGGGN